MTSAGGSPYTNEQGRNGPPRYSALSVADLPVYPTPEDLDISSLYAGTDTRQIFEFTLESGGTTSKRHTWATLQLSSVVPNAVKRPRYTGGDNVEGSIILDLKRPQTIHSVVVLLRGKMMTNALTEGTQVFLESSHTIRSGGAANRGNPNSKYTTPQTVLERGINGNVMYEVVVKIVSGLLRTKDRITANVLYVPVIKAPPLPPLRASAYRAGTYLVGPDDDPSGWHALSPLKLNINVKERPSLAADIVCTVYVANPTVYTRGTVIPCYLICEAPDQSEIDEIGVLLHAFTSQQCVSLKLTQRVLYVRDPLQAASYKRADLAKSGVGKVEDHTSHHNEIGVAVWWTPGSLGDRHAGGDLEPGTRSCLEGEIHLDSAILPSTETPFLVISHAVSSSVDESQDLNISVLPCDGGERGPTIHKRHSSSASHATPQNPSPQELGLFQVTIVTSNGEGSPVPAPFTPRPPRKKKDVTTVQDLQYHSNVFGVFR
ncbi:hypothetical protein H1R20_g13418, partial [Candolleomyces eurysporus]